MSQIKQLEKITCQLDPNVSQREQLIRRVVAYTENHLEQIPDAPTCFDRPDNGCALLNSPIGEAGVDIEQAFGLLRDNVDSTGINITSARHLGYVPGGGNFSSGGSIANLTTILLPPAMPTR